MLKMKLVRDILQNEKLNAKVEFTVVHPRNVVEYNIYNNYFPAKVVISLDDLIFYNEKQLANIICDEYFDILMKEFYR